MIDWDDGSATTLPLGGQPPLGPGSATFNANHTYEPGLNTLEYDVRVTATDDDGGATTQTVTMDGRATFDPAFSVEPDYYPIIDLGSDPANWHWETTFGYEIERAYIGPPGHSIPYVEGLDYDGNYGNSTAGTPTLNLSTLNGSNGVTMGPKKEGWNGGRMEE